MSKDLSLLSQKQISSDELEYLLEQRADGKTDFILVDVREPYEYETSHISGVDMLLPSTRFQEWAPVLSERYKESNIILTCRTANRTAQIQMMLVQMGMDNIIDHIGGIMEYRGTIEQGIEGARHV